MKTLPEVIHELALRGGLALLLGCGAAVAGCAGCTPAPVVASADGGSSTVVALDGGRFALPDGALTPCQAACARLQKEGCPTLADCPVVYGDIEKDRLRAMPNGKPLTCAAVVQAAKLEDVGLRCP